ncbi:MAG: hypothetical protein ACJ8FY_09650 [Gemmataceae bacterium]
MPNLTIRPGTRIPACQLVLSISPDPPWKEMESMWKAMESIRYRFPDRAKERR